MPCIYTRTHARTHTHSDAHAHEDTCTLTNTSACIHTFYHHVCILTRAHAHTHKHTMHTCTRVHTHSDACSRMYAYFLSPACMRFYARTHMHRDALMHSTACMDTFYNQHVCILFINAYTNMSVHQHVYLLYMNIYMLYMHVSII